MNSRSASDVMTSPVVSMKADMTLMDAIDILLRWNISGAPVVNDSLEVVGVLSEHDILNFAMSGDAADTKVSEAMTREVTTAGPSSSADELINLFSQKRIRRIPIVKDGKLVGVVGRRDILREMRRIYSAY